MEEAPVDMQEDILVWWGRNEHRSPNLARMASQFLGCPATSAAPERLFSVAGRIFGDLAQAMKDTNLEARLFAKINKGRRKRVVVN